jgi:septum formation protein
VRSLVLASASASRLSILRGAGFDPAVMVSGVEEEREGLTTSGLVAELARHKAEAVGPLVEDGLVIGCDSLLDLDGEGLGKPEGLEQARANWRRLGGRRAMLMTGHFLLERPSGRCAAAVVETAVTFARPTDEELEAYLATGESLGAAGGFTLEGFGSVFVERVEGDALNVMGISPATLRRLLGELGVPLRELWPVRR